MANYLITNARLWDGDADKSAPADVRVRANRIETVSREPGALAADGCEVIDAGGGTLMPGLVEGHCHPSFTGIAMPSELGALPPEEHVLATAKNARLLLEHGFTSIFEAASAKPRLGVVVRNAIAAGDLVGPRMLAASPEITVTAGLGDERQRHLYQESFGLVADGVDEMMRVCRTCVRDGVDTLKINISGDEFVTHARAEITTMSEPEIAAAVMVARDFGLRTAAHARGAESVKRAVRNGIECIYHCDFADEEALDALESVRDSVFVGPAFGLVHNCVKEGDAAGITAEVCTALDLYRKFDRCCETYHRIRERGIRVVVGGDYGFAVTPMGTNARDIAHFVEYFGYSPVEALRCATVVGAELMGMGDELGRVREGFLADLLIVDGDPLADPSVLQRRERLALIMKDGVVYKDPRGEVAVGGLIAA